MGAEIEKADDMAHLDSAAKDAATSEYDEQPTTGEIGEASSVDDETSVSYGMYSYFLACKHCEEWFHVKGRLLCKLNGFIKNLYIKRNLSGIGNFDYFFLADTNTRYMGTRLILAYTHTISASLWKLHFTATVSWN